MARSVEEYLDVIDIGHRVLVRRKDAVKVEALVTRVITVAVVVVVVSISVIIAIAVIVPLCIAVVGIYKSTYWLYSEISKHSTITNLSPRTIGIVVVGARIRAIIVACIQIFIVVVLFSLVFVIPTPTNVVQTNTRLLDAIELTHVFNHGDLRIELVAGQVVNSSLDVERGYLYGRNILKLQNSIDEIDKNKEKLTDTIVIKSIECLEGRHIMRVVFVLLFERECVDDAIDR